MVKHLLTQLLSPIMIAECLVGHARGRQHQLPHTFSPSFRFFELWEAPALHVALLAIEQASSNWAPAWYTNEKGEHELGMTFVITPCFDCLPADDPVGLMPRMPHCWQQDDGRSSDKLPCSSYPLLLSSCPRQLPRSRLAAVPRQSPGTTPLVPASPPPLVPGGPRGATRCSHPLLSALPLSGQQPSPPFRVQPGPRLLMRLGSSSPAATAAIDGDAAVR